MFLLEKYTDRLFYKVLKFYFSERFNFLSGCASFIRSRRKSVIISAIIILPVFFLSYDIILMNFIYPLSLNRISSVFHLLMIGISYAVFFMDINLHESVRKRLAAFIVFSLLLILTLNVVINEANSLPGYFNKVLAMLNSVILFMIIAVLTGFSATERAFIEGLNAFSETVKSDFTDVIVKKKFPGENGRIFRLLGIAGDPEPGDMNAMNSLVERIEIISMMLYLVDIKMADIDDGYFNKWKPAGINNYLQNKISIVNYRIIKRVDISIGEIISTDYVTSSSFSLVMFMNYLISLLGESINILTKFNNYPDDIRDGIFEISTYAARLVAAECMIFADDRKLFSSTSESAGYYYNSVDLMVKNWEWIDYSAADCIFFSFKAGILNQNPFISIADLLDPAVEDMKIHVEKYRSPFRNRLSEAAAILFFYQLMGLLEKDQPAESAAVFSDSDVSHVLKRYGETAYSVSSNEYFKGILDSLNEVLRFAIRDVNTTEAYFWMIFIKNKGKLYDPWFRSFFIPLMTHSSRCNFLKFYANTPGSYSSDREYGLSIFPDNRSDSPEAQIISDFHEKIIIFDVINQEKASPLELVDSRVKG